MDKLVTVKASNFEADLVVARSYLLDNGINCIISTEYITVSVGGRDAAKLQVSSENYEEAMNLLKKGGFIDE